MTLKLILQSLVLCLGFALAILRCSESGEDPEGSLQPTPSEVPLPEPPPEIPLVDSSIKLESEVREISGNRTYRTDCADSKVMTNLDALDFEPTIDGDLLDWEGSHFSRWIWNRPKGDPSSTHSRENISVFKVARVKSYRDLTETIVEDRLVAGLEFKSPVSSGDEVYFKFQKMISTADGFWAMVDGPEIRITHMKAFFRLREDAEWLPLRQDEYTWAYKDKVDGSFKSPDPSRPELLLVNAQAEFAFSPRFLGDVILSPVWSISGRILKDEVASLDAVVYFQSSEIFSATYFRWRDCLSIKDGRSVHSVFISDARVPKDFEEKIALQTSQMMDWLLVDSKFKAIPNNFTSFLFAAQPLGEDTEGSTYEVKGATSGSVKVKSDDLDLNLVQALSEIVTNHYADYFLFKGDGKTPVLDQERPLFKSIFKHNLMRRFLDYGDYIAILPTELVTQEAKFSYFLDGKFPRVSHILGDFLQSKLDLNFTSYLEKALPNELYARLSRGWLKQEQGFDSEFVPEKLLDTDGDGLMNFEEYLRETNAESRDTDSDGYSDLIELSLGSSPKQFSSKQKSIAIDGIVEDWFLFAPSAIRLEEDPKVLSEGCPENAKIVAQFFVFQKDRIFLGSKSGFQSHNKNVVFRSEIALKNQGDNIQISGKVGDPWLEVRKGESLQKVPLIFSVHPLENEWSLNMKILGVDEKKIESARVRFSAVQVEGVQEVLCYSTGWYNPLKLVLK